MDLEDSSGQAASGGEGDVNKPSDEEVQSHTQTAPTKSQAVGADLLPRSALCYDTLKSHDSVLNFTPFGIRDAWQIVQAYETCLDYQNLLDAQSNGNETLGIVKYLRDHVLYRATLQNQVYWRSLSGSDDLAWAAILNLKCYEKWGKEDFLRYSNKYSGARGAVNLFDEIVSGYYDSEDESVWWNSRHTYKAAISNSTFCLLATMLYKVTKEQKYLDYAENTRYWLLFATKLWERTMAGPGCIRDGLNKNEELNERVWSYNQGPILKALTNLYSATSELQHLKKAVAIADSACAYLVNSWGQVTDRVEFKNKRSASYSFKGIFVRYLAEFVQDCVRNQWDVPEDSIETYKKLVEKNAKNVWNKRQYDKSGYFSPYWDDQDMGSVSAKYKLLATMAAMDLFNSCYKL